MSIRDEYAYHQPTPEQLEKMNELRQAFSDLQDLIDKLTPICEYRFNAGRRLEEAAFWTNKAIVLGED